VGDAGVAEDVRGDVFRDPGTLGKAVELFLHGGVGEGPAVLVHKHEGLADGVERVVVPPGGKVLAGHDKPDIPGLSGLEVDIDDDPILVHEDVLPGKGAHLADPEPAFVEHHDEGAVPAPEGGVHQGLHLGGREQVGGLFGHGVFGGDLEAPDLSVREVGVAVLDRPPIELFEDDDVVGDGVLLEGFAAGAGGGLEGGDALVDVGHAVLQVWPNEPPPPDEGEDDLVCSTCTDVVAGLRFGDELTDQVGVARGERAVGKTTVDGVLRIGALDAMERAV